MVISELALGLLTNLLYDSAKKIPGIHYDPSLRAYKNAIEKLNKKYRQSGEQINTFLRQENVKVAIKKYVENPSNSDLLKILTDECLVSFYKDNIYRKYASSILSTFFEILDAEIENNPELREKLHFYLDKQTNLVVQEITEVSQNTLEVAKQISQNVEEITKIIVEGREDLSKKGSDIDFEESVKE